MGDDAWLKDPLNSYWRLVWHNPFEGAKVNDDDVRQLLDVVTEGAGLSGTISEAYRIETVIVLRTDSDGATRYVTVQIWDRGPAAPTNLRYTVVARDEEGREATGNPADELRTALTTVHWNDLDKDPPPSRNS